MPVKSAPLRQDQTSVQGLSEQGKARFLENVIGVGDKV